MFALIETTLFVFGLVALGYGCGRSGYLDIGVGEALSQFAVGVALPLLLFRTMVSADFGGISPWLLWGVYYASATLTWTVGHLAMTRMFGRDARTGVVGGMSSAYSNLVLLGIPLTLGVFGQEGFAVLSLLVAVHLPLMMMASAALFALLGTGTKARQGPVRVLATFASRLARNPLIIGILAGLAWRATGLPLPRLAERLVDALADVAGPLALFAMGLELKRFGISGHLKQAFALSACKLVLMPALVLSLAWLAGLPPLTAKVAVAAAALPSGVNSYMVAVQFGVGQALASTQISIATACAVLTISIWLSAAFAVFG